MTEQQIKEALSNNFIAAIANFRGFQLTKPTDNGVDYILRYSYYRTQANGDGRWFDSGLSCRLQLKCTTENSIRYSDENEIIYKLEAKTYNDLIISKSQLTPLVLIVLVLPAEKNKWVKVLKDNIKMSKNAYWYYPSVDETEEVKNTSSITIKIPLSNKVDMNFFEEQIKTWVPTWKLPR